MTRKGTRRLSGVNIHDFKQIMTQIRDAADHSMNIDTAAGQLYYCLKAAIESAKKNSEGFGSCSIGDVLTTATLDEKCRTLLAAEFYICHGEYRDEEAFKK